jgi:hypothetical protein
MQHLPVSEVVRRLVRQIACPTCYQRPPGSEALRPAVRRACEAACPLFLHLPTLVRLAPTIGDAAGACDRAIAQSVCGTCRLAPTAGEYCADYAARTRPLSRYGAAVLAALPRVECR